MTQDQREDVETAVRQAEARRCAALVARDLPALEALMHPDLVHIHATGSTDDLQQFLQGVRERLRFLQVERIDYRVRLAGPDTAIASGSGCACKPAGRKSTWISSRARSGCASRGSGATSTSRRPAGSDQPKTQ